LPSPFCQQPESPIAGRVLLNLGARQEAVAVAVERFEFLLQVPGYTALGALLLPVAATPLTLELPNYRHDAQRQAQSAGQYRDCLRDACHE